MDDKEIMEGLLLTTKGACGLYVNGSMESGTKNVNSAFDAALNESLHMQENLYEKMAEKGWYPTQPAEPQKIAQLRQKFSGMN